MLVFENKWEIDSLASFMGLSYQYWNQTGDDSFVNNTIWINAIDQVVNTIKLEQAPTFDPETGIMCINNGLSKIVPPDLLYYLGEALDANYVFSRTADRPTETQFLDGRGQPVKHTGMVKSLFRPSDDATVFPFFIPGNAMVSVELDHLSHLLTVSSFGRENTKAQNLAKEASRLSKEIRDAIYKYGIVEHPTYGKIFACKY